MERILDGRRITTANKRFGVMAAVTPQTILYKFARYYPAASVVEAATSPSRLSAVCKSAKSVAM